MLTDIRILLDGGFSERQALAIANYVQHQQAAMLIAGQEADGLQSKLKANEQDREAVRHKLMRDTVTDAAREITSAVESMRLALEEIRKMIQGRQRYY